MSDTLKKCPFCGGRGAVFQGAPNEEGHRFRAMCYDSNCVWTPPFETEEQAREAWNHRDMFASIEDRPASVRANNGVRLAELFFHHTADIGKTIDSEEAADIYAAPMLLGVVEAALAFYGVLANGDGPVGAYQDVLDAVHRLAFEGEIMDVEKAGDADA